MSVIREKITLEMAVLGPKFTTILGTTTIEFDFPDIKDDETFAMIREKIDTMKQDMEEDFPADMSETSSGEDIIVRFSTTTRDPTGSKPYHKKKPGTGRNVR